MRRCGCQVLRSFPHTILPPIVSLLSYSTQVIGLNYRWQRAGLTNLMHITQLNHWTTVNERSCRNHTKCDYLILWSFSNLGCIVFHSLLNARVVGRAVAYNNNPIKKHRVEHFRGAFSIFFSLRSSGSTVPILLQIFQTNLNMYYSGTLLQRRKGEMHE